MTDNNSQAANLQFASAVRKTLSWVLAAYILLAGISVLLFWGTASLPSYFLAALGTVLMGISTVKIVELLARSFDMALVLSLFSFFSKVVVIFIAGILVKKFPTFLGKETMFILLLGAFLILFVEGYQVMKNDYLNPRIHDTTSPSGKK
ncbi:hypothetical protein KRX54_06505 [Actinomycetaceae bacterium TAE3-ERU4]|nr:hypothetical protein [Actinomycetaceae bacterium TAE3-ERU4]